MTKIYKIFLSLNLKTWPNSLIIWLKSHSYVSIPTYTINFDSLHSKLKSKIKNSCNWKSVCYTISTKYARSKLFTEMSCPIEVGKTACITRLPFNIPTQSLSNSYSLRGLKIYNQQFYCNKNAVIYKHSIDSVEFLAITDITKVNNDYILSGDLHSSFSDSCSKYFLVPNQNHGYIVLF